MIQLMKQSCVVISLALLHCMHYCGVGSFNAAGKGTHFYEFAVNFSKLLSGIKIHICCQRNSKEQSDNVFKKVQIKKPKSTYYPKGFI